MKLDNQEKLQHLPHLEDLVFQYGNDGLIFIDKIFSELLKNNMPVKIKIDGSPSIIVGWKDDKFYVATKSLFNKKTPKINFTEEDVQRNHGDKPELVRKLQAALFYLKDTIPLDEISYQGDLLFTEDSLIEKDSYTLFKPNIIAYGVICVRSDLCLNHYKFGICFHTSYNNERVSYLPSLTNLKHNKDVFILNNDLQDKELKSEVTRNLLKATQSKWLQNNETDFSPAIKQSEKLCKFINKRIREGKSVNSSTELAIDYLKEDSTLDKGFLLKLFACYCKIAECKQFIINDWNKTKFILDEFYIKDDKLIPTDPEGYVVGNHDGIVKFVNRENFSKENFNQEKDWPDEENSET